MAAPARDPQRSVPGAFLSPQDQWTESWHAVGHQVAKLLAAEPVSPRHLELTLASHGALVRLLRGVHRDLTARAQRERSPAAPSLELLERNPVRALGDALERHPVAGGIALTDVMTTRPGPGVRASWHELARASTVAAHAWRAADPESRPRAHQAWSVMADIAALSQGAALLDLEISRAATRLPDDVQVRLAVSPGVLSDRYATAAVQGLRAAGERVLALAHQGPLPDVGPLRQPITRPAPLRQPAQVPAAQAATAELLNRARVISPRDFTVAVHAQARLTQHVVRLTRDPSVAEAARSHLDALTRVVPRGLATIETQSDSRSLMQSQAVLALVANLRPSHDDADRVAAALARSQPMLIDALESTASRQLDCASWLVPNPNERATSVLWVARPPSATVEVPDVLRRLRSARTTADALQVSAGRSPFPSDEARAAAMVARLGLPPREAIGSQPFGKGASRPPRPAGDVTLCRNAGLWR